MSDGFYSVNADGEATATFAIGQERCPAGQYCQSGDRFPCAAGRYGSGTGNTDSACTGACTAGYYCAEGSTSATAAECRVGYYCEAGTSEEVPCPKGRYGNNPMLTVSTACDACGVGKFKSNAGPGACEACPVSHMANVQAAEACVPQLLSMLVEDPGVLDPSVTIGDTMTLSFASKTDMVRVHCKHMTMDLGHGVRRNHPNGCVEGLGVEQAN